MLKAKGTKSGHIEKKVLLQADPQIVYEALTNARDLTRWFCDRATSEPKVGGELTAFWKAGRTGHKGRAVYTKLIPGEFVELLWIDDGCGPNPENAHHILSYAIRLKRGTTEVVMRDEDYPPPDEEVYSILDEGWNSVLLELKDYCESKHRMGRIHPEEER